MNRLVLWQTDDAGQPLHERHIYDDTFAQVRHEDDLVHPTVRQAIRRGLLRFVDRASQAYTGALPLDKRPLDEFFITVLEAALERPTAAVARAMAKRYARGTPFFARLNSWMRDTQGWQLSDDELVQRDNLERAAKFSCYVLVNKIVFYKALRKRFTRLPNIRIPAKLTSAGEAQFALNSFFVRAIKATRDYETVFTGDFGDTLPFLADEAVPGWRDLLRSIDKFDFTQINYDVIGPIFERLISPEERHRYGQHYTKPQIVDLIEAFCIRDAETTVLDPACGGGTFLVRAYNRKKFLAERAGTPLPHERLLDQLFGIDVSAYAAHLTTINLATRDLVDEQNYPLVAHHDFFDAQPGRALFQIPVARGAERKQLRPVLIDQVDAVVGNPPYVRQEEINKPPTASAKERVKLEPRSLDQIKAEARKYKEHLSVLTQRVCPEIKFSGRSDLHVYFWPHGLRFLKDGGHFGFLTSSGWLDVEYGFRLQEFLLKNYAIIAIFESEVEPWFTGARVTTCATILCREPDASKRERNLVRFVRLRSALSEIFPANATEEQRQRAAEALRDRIEGMTANTSERHWRVRVKSQGDLCRLGCRVDGAAPDVQHDESRIVASNFSAMSTEAQPYVGSKWGVYLRAPDLYFELQSRFARRMVPLARLALVKNGIKSGCDSFFFVRDNTDQCLTEIPDPREFRAKYGIQRVQTNKIRIVLAGDKSVHLIEARYLEPEVHNLMETSGVFGIHIRPEDLTRQILLCSTPKSKLKRTRVLKYIQWGEREGFHKGTSCAGRAKARSWYDLSPGDRGDILWPEAHQYRHLAPFNERKLICNHKLFDVLVLQR